MAESEIIVLTSMSFIIKSVLLDSGVPVYPAKGQSGREKKSGPEILLEVRRWGTKGETQEPASCLYRVEIGEDL